jgi:non-ribosomal peptide synthetase component F
MRAHAFINGCSAIAQESLTIGAIECSILSRFHAIAGRYETRIAIDDGETRLTYAEVRRIICHLARRVETVVPAGRPVAIVLPNAVLFPVAALACLAVGRPYVPDYPTARNAEILREASFQMGEVRLDEANDLVPAQQGNVAHCFHCPGQPSRRTCCHGGQRCLRSH